MKAKVLTALTTLLGLTPVWGGEREASLEALGYKNVTILAIDLDGVRIRHEGGVKTIPTEKLSPEAREKLGLNKMGLSDLTPEGLESYRKAKAEEKANAERMQILTTRLQNEGFIICGTILQVIPDEGVLLKYASNSKVRAVDRQVTKNVYRPPPALAKDQSKMIREAVTTTEKDYEQDYYGNVFVECPTAGLIDEQPFELKVYPIGSYTYPSKAGVDRTVKKFTFDFKAALQFKLEGR